MKCVAVPYDSDGLEEDVHGVASLFSCPHFLATALADIDSVNVVARASVVRSFRSLSCQIEEVRGWRGSGCVAASRAPAGAGADGEPCRCATDPTTSSSWQNRRRDPSRIDFAACAESMSEWLASDARWQEYTVEEFRIGPL